jgi:hypothetical protein
MQGLDVLCRPSARQLAVANYLPAQKPEEELKLAKYSCKRLSEILMRIVWS